MAAMFVIRSSEFSQTGLSHSSAAARYNSPDVVHRGVLPGALRAQSCPKVSEPKALLKHFVPRQPPISASSGDRLRQWHRLPRAEYNSPVKIRLGTKEFQQRSCFQASLLGVLVVNEVAQRRRPVKVQAPGDGQASGLNSIAQRQLSTPAAESLGKSAAKKRCKMCNYEKPLRNFEAMLASADGLQWLCRACMAALRAKRSGRPLHHLDLSVEEAWERARVCRCCGQLQEVRDFARNAGKPDGIHVKCRSCDTSYQKSRPQRAPSTQPQACSICGVVKAADEFCKSRKALSGLHPYCKSCHSEKNKGRSRIVKESMLFFPAATKRCCKCGEEKTRSEFHNRKISNDGLERACKECRKKKRLS